MSAGAFVRTMTVSCVMAVLLWPGIASAYAQGTIQRFEIAAPSVGEKARTVRVYLPPSYDTPAAHNRRYPVVYMLHGWPGSDGNLVVLGHATDTADSLIARGAIPEVLLVFPNGRGAGALGRSYWINSYDGHMRVEDYVTRDLVAWVDSHFRTVRDASGRGLIGISEGGDGAVNIAFKHPDLFSACGGHDGDYLLKKGFGTERFLGPEPGASRILAENSPVLYVDRIVPRLHAMTIYIDCGEGDETFGNSQRFHEKLTQLGVPHVYHEFPGAHTWGYWRVHLRDSLLAVAAALH